MSDHAHKRSRSRIVAWAGLSALVVALVVPATVVAAPTTRAVTQGNGGSTEPDTSGNGHFTTFHSDATDLVAGDDNVARDVFVYDRKSKQTIIVSRHSDGTLGNEDSEDPDISADGRWVAFESESDNLVNVDANGVVEDVFLHDRQTGRTILVSVRSNGTQGDLNSTDPSVSANGRFVAFESNATNLVANDNNGVKDVFVFDRTTKQTTLVSRRSNGTIGNGSSGAASISADGRYVAFESDANNLVKNDTNGDADVFIHDRSTGKTILASRRPNGRVGNNESDNPAMSGNGRFVAFESQASNLVSGDTNNAKDVFVFDRKTKVVKRVSVRSNGRQANAESEDAEISASGRWVAFEAEASNLVKGDSNGVEDVFVHDRNTGKTLLVSRRSNGSLGNAGSTDPDVSGDGRWLVFESSATNLVNGDGNGRQDIFLRGPLR
ncbi:MAG: hypothetical protein R6W93_11870 [Candidatus Limnocylindrales bacterium]